MTGLFGGLSDASDSMKAAVRLLAGTMIALGLGCIPDASDRVLVPNARTRAISVADGTRVYTYDLAALEARPRATMRIVEELRIGGDGRSPAFGGGGRAPQVAVSPDGLIFVLEAGGTRIEAFDAEGDHQRTIGRYGQGPGELERPMSIVWIADQLVVRDEARPGILLAFDSEGRTLPSVRVAGRTVLLRSTNRDAVLVRAGTGGEYRRIERVGVSRSDQTTVATITTTPVPRELFQAVMELFVERQQPWITHARDDAFYLMGDRGYEVARVDLSDGVDWIVRLDWPKRAVGPADGEYLDGLLEGLENRESLRPPEGWARPTTLPALLTIRSDERNLLYVFPADRLRRDPEWLEWRPRPVHVYSSDGRLIEVGTLEMSPTAWQVVQDGSIYGAVLDPKTLEWAIIKSRLVR